MSAFVAVWALAIWFLGAFRAASSGSQSYSPDQASSLLRQIVIIEILAVFLVAPALTAGALSGEIERRTMDLLLATPLGPGRIVLGKFGAAIAYLLLLISTVLPGLSLVFILGGVSPADFLRSQLLVLVTGVYLAAIGMEASSLSRNTARATILADLWVALLSLGPILAVIMASFWWSRSTSNTGMTTNPWIDGHQILLLAISPIMLAVSSIVPLDLDSQSQIFYLQMWLSVFMLGLAAWRLGPWLKPAHRRRVWLIMGLSLLGWLVWVIGWPGDTLL